MDTCADLEIIFETTIIALERRKSDICLHVSYTDAEHCTLLRRSDRPVLMLAELLRHLDCTFPLHHDYCHSTLDAQLHYRQRQRKTTPDGITSDRDINSIA